MLLNYNCNGNTATSQLNIAPGIDKLSKISLLQFDNVKWCGANSIAGLSKSDVI